MEKRQGHGCEECLDRVSCLATLHGNKGRAQGHTPAKVRLGGDYALPERG